MASMLDAQIELPAGACSPDRWEVGDGIELRLDHVISRDAEGRPVSYVGDFVWDWTFYTPRKKKSLLYFRYWVTISNKIIHESDLTPDRVARMRELQYLMVLLIYRAEGKILGYRSFHIKLWTLWKFARFAEARSCSVRDVLERAELLDCFLADVPDYEGYRLIAWINFLRTLDSVTELGFEVAEPKRWKAFLKRTKQLRHNFRQYAPLPTAIYGALINALSDELDGIEAHKDQLFAALRAAIDEHALFKEQNPNRGSTFGPHLVARYGLQDYLTNRGLKHSLDGLNVAVADVFAACKMQIHAFSGMRNEEAMHLPYHCMETVTGTHGRTHCLIAGVTTKLDGARSRRTRWVTTEADGFRAIRLAQEFAKVIYESLGVKPGDSDETRDDYPLFPSTQYLPWGRRRSGLPKTHFSPSRLNFVAASDGLRRKLRPVIEEADIVELEEIDPFRDWRGEPKFEVGQPWPLTTHQLRRSLALYANASGLVRLSSLRRQLQHITREMAQYYGRGSAFAKNFLAEDTKAYKQHICFEWQDAEQEAVFLAFVRDVINCDEPLYGPAGTYFERQKRRGEVMPEKELKRQIKMGRFAYKDHPLGGCTNSGFCDKEKGLRLIGTVCATEACKNLIGKHSKIIKLIPLQRKVLSRLDPGSITYQMEKEELDALEAMDAAWRPQNNPAETSFGTSHA